VAFCSDGLFGGVSTFSFLKGTTDGRGRRDQADRALHRRKEIHTEIAEITKGGTVTGQDHSIFAIFATLCSDGLFGGVSIFGFGKSSEPHARARRNQANRGEIGDRTGFASADILGRAFTRVLLTTPSEYRNRFLSSGIGKRGDHKSTSS
jgi:AraC-like DNA-binding protein